MRAIPWSRKSLQATSLPIFSPIFKMLHISTKIRFLPKRNGGYSEVRLASLSLIGLKNCPCVLVLCSKNSTFLRIICILHPFGPSHEVEGHFKQCPCLFSVPFEKCYILPTKNRFLPRKTKVRSRSHWPAWAFLVSKIAFVGHCCVQKIVHFCT